MSASQARRLLIAYDISDDPRRSRLAKVLGSYGDRVQFSVFVVDATPVRIARLRRAIESVIVLSEDSVLICDLGVARGVEAHRFHCLGRQPQVTGADSFVV